MARAGGGCSRRSSLAKAMPASWRLWAANGYRLRAKPWPRPARQGHGPSSVLAQAASADDRAPGANRPRVRGADRGCAGALSRRGRTADDDPGVSATAASVIIAEIGVQMSCMATVGHLSSWAGLCPQLNESAGKVRSRRLRATPPVAQNRTGAVRVGGYPLREQLFTCPVPTAESPPWSEKSCPGSGRFRPYRRALSASG